MESPLFSPGANPVFGVSTLFFTEPMILFPQIREYNDSEVADKISYWRTKPDQVRKPKPTTKTGLET